MKNPGRSLKKGCNIGGVVKASLCTGCGTCEGVCPTGAISLRRDKDIFRPVVDGAKCNASKGCRVCYTVCPGHQLDITRLSTALFPEAETDPKIGRYQSVFHGNAVDSPIRFHAASGGVTTQIVVKLLRQNKIDAAVVIRLGSASCTEPEVVLAYTPEEVVQAQSSKYCPVALGGVIRDILDKKLRVAVVGLPCHIHGFRKAEETFPALKDAVQLYIGIYCSALQSFQGTEYIFRRFQIPRKGMVSFSYRDEGCPGSLKASYEDGRTIKVPYHDYYRKLKSFFIPYRCMQCVDHFAELADISTGDLNIPPYNEDKVGFSSLIVRSSRGRVVIEALMQSGGLELHALEAEPLIRSQQFSLNRKKRQIKVRYDLLRLVGRKTCNYDYAFPKSGLKAYAKSVLASIIIYAEMFVGKRPRLWPLIDFTNSVLKKSKSGNS